MIGYDEALAQVLARTPVLPILTRSLSEARGRYLAAAVRARWDTPRWDQSAMDGYAVRLDDVAAARPDSPAALRLAGRLPAGAGRRPALRAGTAVKVFTGSLLPRGTEAVVVKEVCEEREGTVLVGARPEPGEHVRRRAEEFRRGDPLLDAGTRLTPPVIGLLAAFGHDRVRVRRRPSVTVITMGDELIAPGERPGPGQVHDANRPGLVAALRDLGIARIRATVVRDDAAALRRAIAQGLRATDVVVSAGGASVGDHDHVRDAAAAAGVREVFRSVAIKPGKPNFFGTASGGGAAGRSGTAARRGRRRLYFGVPGNPVSALVSFQQLVRPALLKMMGAPAASGPFVLRAELLESCRKAPERLEWLRGHLERDGERLLVRPDRRQGSHMLGGLAEADCLIHFPRGREVLPRGAPVEITLLRWEG